MAIVIRNDKSRGRFFRYRVDGVPKSVWVDGFSEVVVPELSDTSTMLDKVAKAKAEKLERLSNSKTINQALIEKRSKVFKDVSDTDKWRPKVLRLQTGFNTYLFERDGKKFLFASPPDETLRIGADIRGSRLNTLGPFYDGTYSFGGFNYTINSSEIIAIQSIATSGSTALTFSDYVVNYTATTTNYTAYTSGATVINDVGAQWFSSNDGTGTFWTSPSGGFHYVTGDDTYIVNVAGGQVTASRLLTDPVSSSSITLYSNLGVQYTRYYDSGDNPLSNGTQFYTDAGLSNTWNTNITVKYDVPGNSVNRFLSLNGGQVQSVSSYTNDGGTTINLSGATATTSTAYVLSSQNVDQLGVYWFSDTELLSVLNLTGVYIDFTQNPNRYIRVSGGRVLEAGDITWGGGAVTYTSWSVRDASAKVLTIYTQQGDLLTTVGVTVYANSDGTGTPKNGNYTYNDSGTNKTITISGGKVTKVANAGR